MNDKEMFQLSKVIINNLKESLYISGDLNQDDLKHEELALKKIKEILKKQKIGITIDHTNSILEEARKYSETNFELSITLYATYIEHMCNSVINIYCIKNGINKKIQKEIIRNININGKLSWLLALIGLPKFNEKHLKIIKEINQKRNEFIHYKWQGYDEEYNEGELMGKIEKTITYMKRYHTKVQYNGKKGIISSYIKH